MSITLLLQHARITRAPETKAIAPLCQNSEQFGAEVVGGGGQHSFGLDAALA